jgi:hypothetical protein
MRRFFRGAGVPCALAGLLLMVATMRSVAQNDAALTFPIHPAPADCQVAPRPVEDLIPILTTSNAETTTEVASAKEETIPLGYPAGRHQAIEVTATLTEIIACLNAGDVLRALALFTDDGLHRFLGPWAAEGAWTEADVRQFATTAVPLAEDEQQTLLGVANVARLNDGRLTAFAIIADPFETSGQPQALFLYFSYQDGRWRIDDFSELSKF